MSYDISLQRHIARTAGLYEGGEDAARLEFLQRLDGAPFAVTDWEAKFMASILKRQGNERQGNKPMTFSERQREKIDQMRREYAHRLPGSGPAVAGWAQDSGPRSLPTTTPGTCAFLVRMEGRRQCCGEPAVKTLMTGLELCEAHAQERATQLERIRQIKSRR